MKLQHKSFSRHLIVRSFSIKTGFVISTILLCTPCSAEVLSGRFTLIEGKCAHPISINLVGDRLTVYAKDDEGEFTRRYERSAKSPKLFEAIDGFGGSVRYTGMNSLTVTQPDLGVTCKFRRSN